MRYNEKVVIEVELEEIDENMTVEELVRRMGCDVGSEKHRTHIEEKYESIMRDELNYWIKSLNIKILNTVAHDK